MLGANIINGSLLVAALWENTNRRILLGWVVAVVALAVIRVVLWRCFRRGAVAGCDSGRWRLRYTVGATISGLLWGSTALLFIRGDDSTSLVLVSFVIGGMGAGAVTSLSAHLPAFYLYLAGSLIPLELRLLTLNDRMSLAMSGMVAIYVIGLVIIGRNFNAALTHALVLNEKNKRLLATRDREVQLRTADLQATNAELEREIGERKDIEAKLEEARAVAEQANLAKSRFLAAASHDLRQPLQSMFLFASFVRPFVTDAKGAEALTLIERSMNALKSMLDSLLDLSRLDVTVTQPRITTFRLRPLLDDIVAAYRDVAAAKTLDLTCGARADTWVLSDPMLLGRMVRNLVENAIRYSERGGIVLSSHTAGKVIRIEVADTGIGIAPDQLERVFEEFHQVSNPERSAARGLGLGLAIVQRLSAILGHPVDVRSELGVGSTFSIDVPVAEGGTPEDELGIKELEAPSACGKGRQVVVIDDDPMVLMAVGRIFEQWGYTVAMAAAQDEAMGRLRAEVAPDMIVADYRLRDGRLGTDAIKGIRAAFGVEVPSIVLTGETGTECAAAAESLKALVLHKPVTLRGLASAVERLMGADGVR